MPIAVSSVGRPTRDGYEEKGGNFKVSAYMGGVVESDPQAFLVHDLHSPGFVAPHFHHVRQFQVIVSKGVKLGPREVPEISFHYADPSTPYGPIVPGEEPLAFFTLRSEKSDGTFMMPGSRDKLERKAGRRNIVREVPTEAPVNEIVTLIERHDDGLAAFRVRINPGDQVAGVSDPSNGGQYYLVMDGSLAGEAEELPRFSLIFASPDEPAPLLKAGTKGADVLIMQFPTKHES